MILWTAMGLEDTFDNIGQTTTILPKHTNPHQYHIPTKIHH